MTLWIIEPRDPLIVRDGKPFGPNPGARATTLPFPFPSTIVGTLRTKAGLDQHGQFDRTQIATVLAKTLHGPLLVELDPDADAIAGWLLPAPADALLLKHDDKDQVRRLWLAPRSGSAITNMPSGLVPVAPATAAQEKVSPDAPRFWHCDELCNWLGTPADNDRPLDLLGIRGLEINTRMHVSIQPDQQTAVEGALFQTSGLEFTWRDRKNARRDLFEIKRLALAAWFGGSTPYFAGGFAPLGGERRLMRWQRLEQDAQPFDGQQREALFAQIAQDRRCRVLLLTPAHFSDGYRPPLTWTRGGVAATLKAACVPRMQTVSGWDLAHRNENGRYGRPKPTRRLAPAGSVYFVEFPAGANIRAWLDATWMQNVSDDEQSCRDGFGLAVVGTWPEQEGA